MWETKFTYLCICHVEVVNLEKWRQRWFDPGIGDIRPWLQGHLGLYDGVDQGGEHVEGQEASYQHTHSTQQPPYQ